MSVKGKGDVIPVHGMKANGGSAGIVSFLTLALDRKK